MNNKSAALNTTLEGIGIGGLSLALAVLQEGDLTAEKLIAAAIAAFIGVGALLIKYRVRDKL